MTKKTASQANSQAWQGKLLKAIIVFLSWLPLSWVRVLAWIYGSLSYYIPNESRRVALINIKAVYPELSETQQKQLLKQNLVETSKTFLELGAMWCWPSEKLLPLVKQVSGQEYFDKAWQNQKGLILIAPHVGNWELSGTFISEKYPSTFLYQPPNVASIENFMVTSRERFGAKLAPTDAKGVRTLMKVLKNKGLTAILPDQDPGKVGGVYAPFFNRPARTMTLLSKLVQKTDCAVVAIVMQRLPGLSNGYHLHFLPVTEEIADDNPEIATQALNSVVEQCVELAPEQYLWSYKRYRKPPEGIKDLYKP